jgi:hypothetical protein
MVTIVGLKHCKRPQLTSSPLWEPHISDYLKIGYLFKVTKFQNSVSHCMDLKNTCVSLNRAKFQNSVSHCMDLKNTCVSLNRANAVYIKVLWNESKSCIQ